MPYRYGGRKFTIGIKVCLNLYIYSIAKVDINSTYATKNRMIFRAGGFYISDFLLNFDKSQRRKQMNALRKVIRFYVEGFREMTVGRTLWAIILVKLFIMFAVLKVFFFPDLLAGKSPAEKADYVLENLAPPASGAAPSTQ